MDIDFGDRKLRWRFIGMCLVLLSDVFIESRARDFGIGIIELLFLLFSTVGLVMIIANTEVFVWTRTRLFELLLYIVLYIGFAIGIFSIMDYYSQTVVWYFMMVPISSIIVVYWDYYERGKLFLVAVFFGLLVYKFSLLVFNFAIFNM